MFSELLISINDLLWGTILLPCMIAIGVFLTVRLNFPQIRKFRKSFQLTLGKFFSFRNRKNGNFLSAWETASTALASTIGTGSIVGVAVAIKAGGPGVLFWMWISAFLGMAIKYSEIILAMKYREKSCDGFYIGGPMLYLQKGVSSRFLSTAFATLCLAVSFCMGNSVQSNAIATVLLNQAEIKPVFSGLILMIVAGAVILGGAKRIAAINAKLVPFMSLVYICFCMLILLLKLSALPGVFHQIFKEAFRSNSILGGSALTLLMPAMKNGFSKGIFSNEAGLGSAPIAHASSGSSDLEEQGAWGIFEVFFTTMVICTLTGLVILSSDSWNAENLNAVQMTYHAFSELFPRFGGLIVSVSTVLFSFSTILGWAFYGEICLRFLFRKFKVYCLVYRPLFVLVVFFGALIQIDVIWSVSEFANGLMAIPNLIGVVLLAGKIENSLKNNQHPA